MFRQMFAAMGLTALFGMAIACGDRQVAPTTPSGTTPATTSNAAADGSTLKATAPVPQSPINGAQPAQGQVSLVIANSTTTFASGVALSYRFEISDSAGAVVE